MRKKQRLQKYAQKLNGLKTARSPQGIFLILRKHMVKINCGTELKAQMVNLNMI